MCKRSKKWFHIGCPPNFGTCISLENESRYEESKGTLWSGTSFYLLGHHFDPKFRLICSQWFFKVLSQAWDPQKDASKKIFKRNFSAHTSSRNFLTKLPKLLTTHHLGFWPKKFFLTNFQISKFFLEFPMLWPSKSARNRFEKYFHMKCP